MENKNKNKIVKMKPTILCPNCDEDISYYCEKSFQLGKSIRTKELIKMIETIETEYPDDDGTPFRISPEQFKRELIQKLKGDGE